jgi:serine/threonine-protein kinase
VQRWNVQGRPRARAVREPDYRVVITTPPRDEILLPGTRVGAYVARTLLAQGGAAAVYAGEHADDGSPAAIKILHRTLARTPQSLRRFRQEVALLGRLSHPNVIAILDSGTLEEVPFLVTELVAGRSLRDWMWSDTPIDAGEAFAMFRQLCNALACVHGDGIVHRDLKPENIMVSEGGDGLEVKLIDFGIAKLLSEDRALVRTDHGVVVGSPGYMAPEQATGVFDHRADVFALGLVMYEVFADAWPWDDRFAARPGRGPGKRPAPRPSPKLARRCPELSRLVMQCLDSDPLRRPSHAGDIRDALDRASEVWPLPYVGDPDILRKLRK